MPLCYERDCELEASKELIQLQTKYTVPILIILNNVVNTREECTKRRLGRVCSKPVQRVKSS